MTVSKEKNGCWRVIYRYATWQGERKQMSKRGFETKRKALDWKREQLQRIQSTMDMSFESSVAIYQRDMSQRLREHTWQTKNNIISTKLLPYFAKKRMNQIKASDIIAWQNQMMNEKNKQTIKSRTIFHDGKGIRRKNGLQAKIRKQSAYCHGLACM